MKAQISRRREELYGVVLSFSGLILALCLLSYSPKDPCLFLRVGQTGPVSNWMGPFGATLSGWLFLAAGYASWLLFPALAVYSYKFIRGLKGDDSPRSHRHPVIRALGFGVLLASVSALLDLVAGEALVDGEGILAGGVSGRVLGGFFTGLMGYPGALVFTILFMVVSLMAAVDFSPVASGRRAAAGAVWLWNRFCDFRMRRREARKRHHEVEREREVMEQTRVVKEIKIVVEPKKAPEVKAPAKPKQEKLPFIKEGSYELPSTELLDEVVDSGLKIDRDGLLLNARILENKLKDFGVTGEVVEVHPGPVITMYEYKPASGVKINKIAALADDLAMALSAISVRIIAPIPGKDVVGIEISNRERETVYLREIIESESFSRLKSPLPMALGKDITGNPFAFDLRKAPHLLVAGSTGSGKSVSINAMIMSVLFRSTPSEVRLLMIDPKRLELSIYEGIPHLIHRVIADPKDASMALKWAVAEMERRYFLLAKMGVRHIDSYNRAVAKLQGEDKSQGNSKKKKAAAEATGSGETLPSAEKLGEGSVDEPLEELLEPLPLVLVIIDELADLMMVAARDIEESICRLAQMARAAGIHLLLATQRPSVDVITGLIKANFPSRIGFKVASKTDSRTILDQNGSERLLGHGDMLFLAPGTSSVARLHGAFVSDQEIKRVTEFWREQGEPCYEEEILKPKSEEGGAAPEDQDEKYMEALRIVASTRQASISMLQRKLKIGYNRAARIIERMEEEGVVGPSDGVKPRDVLIDAFSVEQRTG